MIFEKFKNRVVIDEVEIKNNLDKEINNLSLSKDVFLSEILIRNSKDLKLDKVYSEILKSIQRKYNKDNKIFLYRQNINKSYLRP